MQQWHDRESSPYFCTVDAALEQDSCYETCHKDDACWRSMLLRALKCSASKL